MMAASGVKVWLLVCFKRPVRVLALGNLPPRCRPTPSFGEGQSHCVPAAPQPTSLPRRAACEHSVHLPLVVRHTR